MHYLPGSVQWMLDVTCLSVNYPLKNISATHPLHTIWLCAFMMQFVYCMRFPAKNGKVCQIEKRLYLSVKYVYYPYYILLLRVPCPRNSFHTTETFSSQAFFSLDTLFIGHHFGQGFFEGARCFSCRKHYA